MKKINFMLMFLALNGFGFFSMAHAASICANVSKEFADYTHAPAPSAPPIFPLPWQDLIWLKSQLGAADMNSYAQTIAIWKKYNYTLIAENGTVITSGQKPQLLNNYKDTPTIDEATSVLGAADTLVTNNLTDYYWNCDTGGSTLSVTTNDSTGEDIISYKGAYCPDAATKDKCQTYSNYHASFPQYRNIGAGLQKADLYIQHPTLTPQYTISTAADIGLKQTLAAAKTILHTNAKTFAELQTLAIQDVTVYYQKLQKCTPGTYQYPLPFILGGKLISDNVVAPFFYFMTTKITGLSPDNKCVVESKAVIGADNGAVNCAFSPATLAFFTPQQAAADADFQVNLTPYAADQTRKFMRECRVYSNGTLLPG
jgi:hypothetical protein